MTDILNHIDQGVMTLTFNRVDKKNSITSAMYADLADALEQAQQNAQVRVVLIQGHETIFSAGNDIADFLNNPPADQNSPVFRFLRNISTFPKPVLAAVAGPAVGIGTTLLFHCDLVYAGDNAAFSMPFVNLGICPEAASTLLVPQLMGYQRAAEQLATITEADVLRTLDGLVAQLELLPPADVRALLSGVIEKVELDPGSLTTAIHYRIAVGHRDKVASPRGEAPNPRFRSTSSVRVA